MHLLSLKADVKWNVQNASNNYDKNEMDKSQARLF